ncbi:c2 calcium-dependent membrane targeting [Anaeramoeba flamelloides]|uniref:C2 calcium-dependent membrane targeting n=1 Tax=Anaeramoeba flamelloides TaxID=1746091 RepID=A0AAV7YZ28_9EUKA|nr:c2 calcium-dependent membrane targeting [Anaeramoeba flamelloides]
MSRNETYGSKQVTNKDMKSLIKIEKKYLDGKGRADFQIQVHIIEARGLKGRGRNAMSDPLTQVLIDGHKQHTKVFKNTASCTFDHLFFFNFKWKPEEFQKKKIAIKVLDSNTVRRNVLIGQYELDSSFVYGETDHEIWHRWLLLTDTDSNDGGQGFLKVSVIVLGPGDQSKTHESYGIDDEEVDENNQDLQSLILRPPEIESQGYHLKVYCYKAEHLPKMDRFGKADPFVSVRFGGNIEVRSKVKKKTFSPVWNEELRIPVFTPTLSNMIELQLYDWEKKTKSNDLISSAYFRFTDIQLEEMPPRWINFYGPPKTKTRTMFKKGITDETVYKGRALIAIATDQAENPRLGTGTTSPARDPVNEIYQVRFDIFEACELKTKALETVYIEVLIGNYKISSKKAKCKKGVATWYQQIPEKEIALPKDLTQCPFVFVNIYLKNKVLGKARIGYLKIPFADCLGFDKKPTWGGILPDKKSSTFKDGVIPGFLLSKLEIGKRQEAQRYPRSKLIKPRQTKYELRAHIFQGKQLPPADKNGLSDPYCRVRIGRYNAKTQIIQETLNPNWFETVVIPVELPDPINLAPNISVMCYDWDKVSSDDLLGRFDVNTTSLSSTFPSAPVWYDLYMDDPEITYGKILASFQLIPYHERKNFPIPSLIPDYKTCVIELSAVGLRDLLPYQMRKIQKPFIEMGISSPPEKEEETEETSTLNGKKKRKKKKTKKKKKRKKSESNKITLSTKPSKLPTGSNPNHLESFQFVTKIPINHLFASDLNIRVYDKGRMGNPLVGTGAISLAPFIPWADVPLKMENLPKKIDQIPGAEAEGDFFSGDEDDENNKDGDDSDEEIDIIPQNIEEVNQREFARVIFETKKSKLGFVGLRTIPEVREMFLEELADKSDEDGGYGYKDPKSGRNKSKYELEHELEALPFHEYSLTRGKIRGLSTFEKMFKDKSRNPNTTRTVGQFKGNIKIYDVETIKEAPQELDLKKLFTPQRLIVRAYILRGLHFVPKDSNGTSDPYIIISNGSGKANKINDRKNYHKKSLCPNFFKCYELPCTLPGDSVLKIQVWDWDRVSSDDLIGETVIDLENRWFCEDWKNMKPKPVEYRTLWAPTSSNPQGKVEMWLEILTEEQAARTPQTPLEPPKPDQFEIRAIVWNTKDVVFKDKNMSDIFVTCQMNEGKKQSSDIHWRSKDGKGAFNWRYKFPIELPARVARLKLQLWDKDILNPNDSIGEANINLTGLCRRAYKNKSAQTIKKQFISLLHPNFEDDQGQIEISLEILTQAEAESKPAGFGRKDPNSNPFLDKPVRPYDSFAPWRLDKYAVIGFNKHKGKLLCAALCCIIILIMFIVIYLKTIF